MRGCPLTLSEHTWEMLDWGERQGQNTEDDVGYAKTLRFHADTTGLLRLDLHFGKSALGVCGGLTGVRRDGPGESV